MCYELDLSIDGGKKFIHGAGRGNRLNDAHYENGGNTIALPPGTVIELLSIFLISGLAVVRMVKTGAHCPLLQI